MIAPATHARSERGQVADRLWTFVKGLGLGEVYAGQIDPEKGVRHYTVMFCRARSVDGWIHVYSTKFIRIGYTTAIRDLPRTERATVASVEDAEAFLQERFGSRRAK